MPAFSCVCLCLCVCVCVCVCVCGHLRVEGVRGGTVHGQAVNRQQQTVFLITDGADPDFIPACGYSFEEPISVGRYVQWDKSYAMPVVKTQTHCTQKFEQLQLTSILKQQTNLNAKLINTTSYRPGHTVGSVRINEIDRTNTDPRLVPCEVFEVETEGH